MPPCAPSSVRAQACEMLGEPSLRALHERRRQGHTLPAAVEEDPEPSFFDGGDSGSGAVDERGARGPTTGVEEHLVPRPVLPLSRPPGPTRAGPVSVPVAARRSRTRSATSSASVWETTRAATCSAP